MSSVVVDEENGEEEEMEVYRISRFSSIFFALRRDYMIRKGTVRFNVKDLH